MRLLTRLPPLLALLPALILIANTVIFHGGSGSLLDLAGLFLTPEKIIPLRVPTEAPILGPFTIQPGPRVGTIGPEFASFSLDIAQVIGSPWWKEGDKGQEGGGGSHPLPPLDLDDPALDRLIVPLLPAWLRIGGTAADEVWYDLSTDQSAPAPLPPGYHWTMKREQWDAVHRLVRRHGLRLAFTLNAGPGPRGGSNAGAWEGNNTAALLEYSRYRGYHTDLFELGNEVNAFVFLRGPASTVPARRYIADLARARDVLASQAPASAISAQGSAWWPLLGEPLPWLAGMTLPVLEHGPDLNGPVLWHYYPQQSSRAPVASVRARTDRLLDPRRLDEAAIWARHLRNARDRFAPKLPLWLGETSHAQAGGEPGVSGTWVSALWWLDQLGLMAREGVAIVVRQTLVGGDYGLASRDTMQPRVDWWITLLWKRLMGPEVYQENHSGPATLRLYLHRQAAEGDWTLAAINLSAEQSVTLQLPAPAKVWQLGSPDTRTEAATINGRLATLEALEAGGLLLPAQGGEEMAIPPLGITFAVFPDRYPPEQDRSTGLR